MAVMFVDLKVKININKDTILVECVNYYKEGINSSRVGLHTLTLARRRDLSLR